MRVPVTVIVVLDTCTDGSAAVANAHPARGVETVVVHARCVGAARAAGMAELLRRQPVQGTWLATTDADSVVPPHWLLAQRDHAGQGARVVAGTITVQDWQDRSRAVRDRAHRDYHAAAHRHIHGANLSFYADAYCAAGGFAQLSCHEDVSTLR